MGTQMSEVRVFRHKLADFLAGLMRQHQIGKASTRGQLDKGTFDGSGNGVSSTGARLRHARTSGCFIKALRESEDLLGASLGGKCLQGSACRSGVEHLIVSLSRRLIAWHLLGGPLWSLFGDHGKTRELI
jgi:hypothetical protein